MKQLTICTHRYSQQLEAFAACATNSGWLTTSKAGWKGGLYSVICQYNSLTPAFTGGVMTLLTDIALQENPIYQNSLKLQDMAHDLRETPLYTAGLRYLIRFMRHSRVLHLEGYVAFRMAEYREKLDMMSYSLIKKLNLIQHD